MNFLGQLKRFPDLQIVIVDGGSSFPRMRDVLHDLKSDYKIVQLDNNPGPHWFYKNIDFYNNLEDVFLVSDPDIEFHSQMPNDFFNIFLEISEIYCIGKVGSSIKLPSKKFENELIRFGDSVETIKNSELKFMKNELFNSKIMFKHYLSPIDTTLALYNKKWFDPYTFLNSIRVSDEFEIIHLPWNETNIVPEDEFLFYKNFSQHSYYGGAKSDSGEPFRFISHRAYLELLNRLDVQHHSTGIRNYVKKFLHG